MVKFAKSVTNVLFQGLDFAFMQAIQAVWRRIKAPGAGISSGLKFGAKPEAPTPKSPLFLPNLGDLGPQALAGKPSSKVTWARRQMESSCVEAESNLPMLGELQV